MANTVYDFGSIAPLRRARQASKIELAARLGYAAKGLVYATLGALVAMAALGFAMGKITDTRGALEIFNSQAWGGFALAVITAGLLGFAIWRAVQAVRDTDDKGSDPTALAQRAGLLVSGGIYASLALYAAKLLFDMGVSREGTDQKAAEVMAHEGGTWLIGALGVVVIGIGLYQLWRVITAKFKDHWKTGEMSAQQERTATIIARFGIGARAVAFVVIGAFLSWAALTGQPGKAQGMEGALSDVAQSAFGQPLIGLAGLGLFCYGIYCFINALFREINDENSQGTVHKRPAYES